jgi:peptidoglycan/LPS O-acetylase OafA/YrhL
MTQDNRYTPPAATVADIPPSDRGPRPDRVRTAVALLWASLGLGVATWVLGMVRDPETHFSVFIVVFTLLLLVFGAWVNAMVYWGKNWARILTLVLTLLSLLFVFVPVEGSTTSPIEDVITFVDLALCIAAVYLLFTRPGSLWFKPDR